MVSNVFNIVGERSPIANYDDRIQQEEITASINSLSKTFLPASYFSRVKRAKYYYDSDPLISGLVDLVIRLANTTLDFNFSDDKDKIHNDVFNYFKKNANIDVQNVLPGLKVVNREILKHLLISGKADIQWEWSNVVVNKKNYTLPTKMFVHPSLSSKLETIDELHYEGYKILLGISNETYNRAKDDPNAVQSLREISYHKYIELPENNSFSIRYNHSSDDGTYPIPFLTPIFDDCELRRNLRNMDITLSTAGMILLLVFTYGDLENERFYPKDDRYDENGNLTQEGDVRKLQELINALGGKYTGGLALPKHVSLDIKQADMRTLFNLSKWIPATINIFQRFGIVFNPSNTSIAGDFLNSLNTEGFVSLISDLQMHLEAFYNKLSYLILSKNKDKLYIEPDCKFNTINLYTDNYRSQLIRLWLLGFLPSEELAKAYNKDWNVILTQLKEELKYKDLITSLVRVSFSQKVAGKKPSSEADLEVDIESAYETERYYHFEGEDEGKEFDRIRTKRLPNGVLLRIGYNEDGTYGVVAVLIPKDKFTEEEAKKWYKKYREGKNEE